MDENQKDMLSRLLREMLINISQNSPVEKVERMTPNIPGEAFSFIAEMVRAMFNAFNAVGFDDDQSYELAYLLFERTLPEEKKRGHDE